MQIFFCLWFRDVISWVASSNYRITLSEIGKSYLRGLLLHLYLILKRNSRNSSSTTVCSSSEESIKKTFLSLQTFRNKTLQSYFHHEMDWWLLCQFSVPFYTQNTKYYKTVRVHGGWKLLKNYHSIFFVFFADLKKNLSFRTKIGGKYQNSKIQRQHFGWFSNNVCPLGIRITWKTRITNHLSMTLLISWRHNYDMKYQ